MTCRPLGWQFAVQKDRKQNERQDANTHSLRQAEGVNRKHKQKYNDNSNTNKYKQKMRQSEQHARACS